MKGDELFSRAMARVKRMRTIRALALACAGLMLAASNTTPDGRPTPTGLEVPRWLSIKSEPVRARSGPGREYQALWDYRAASLPVQVVAETVEWRKVCDPEGNLVWLHRSTVSSQRTVFNRQAAPISVHARRSESSPVRARMAARATLSLDRCEDGWCRVRARRLRGWVRESALFGTASAPLCDALAPAGSGRGAAGR